MPTCEYLPVHCVQDGSVPCSYRIAQEGLPLLLPHITRQRLTLSSADFMRLLTERSLPLPLAAQPEQPAAAPAAAAEPAAVAAAVDAEMSDAEEPPPAPAAAADAAANGADAVAAAAAGGANTEEEPAAAAGAKAEGDAIEAAAGNGAAADKPAGQQQQQQRKGGPASEKPRGPPIDDEATLAQLANIGNGCCVATLRCTRRLQSAAMTNSCCADRWIRP